MLILLIILAISILAIATRAAVKYHVKTVAYERERRHNNYLAARALADHIDTANFARDFYRAALVEISQRSPIGDPNGDLARRFLELES